MNTTIIYPGTFDPITLGHMDLVKRISSLFDNVVVAVAANTRKSSIFSQQQRIELAKLALKTDAKIKVLGFKGLLVDFAREIKANVILRGLRAVSDFEYEFQLAGMNRKMAPDIETIFMSPAEQFTFLSATMVREIAELGGDISEFVHPEVAKAVYKMFERGRHDE